MANLYEPILPKHAEIIKKLLGIKEVTNWEPVVYDANKILNQVPMMFERLDVANIDLGKGSEDPFMLNKS